MQESSPSKPKDAAHHSAKVAESIFLRSFIFLLLLLYGSVSDDLLHRAGFIDHGVDVGLIRASVLEVDDFILLVWLVNGSELVDIPHDFEIMQRGLHNIVNFESVLSWVDDWLFYVFF